MAPREGHGRTPPGGLSSPGLADRGAQQRLHEHVGGGGAEAAGELRADALGDRVVADVLGLDHLARDVLEVAEAVGEAKVDAALAGPDEAAEDFGGVLEPLA